MKPNTEAQRHYLRAYPALHLKSSRIKPTPKDVAAGKRRREIEKRQEQRKLKRELDW